MKAAVMNNFYLIFVLSLTLSSCHQENNKMEKKQSVNDSLKSNPPKIVLKKEKTEIFSKNKKIINKTSIIDSLSKENLIVKKIDTFYSDRFFKINLNKKFSYPYLKKTKRIISYRIIVKVDKISISTTFLVIELKNNELTKIIFQKLKKDATTPKDKRPGLTYENDIVTIKANKIYWFNTPCGMSNKNTKVFYKKLSKVFDINTNEFIHCKCGTVICKIK